MEPQVAFYRLSRKIVSNQQAVPDDARQVMYYSLAIGHHVGVMDCLDELMAVPADSYRRCLEHLPDGDARRKLEGALTWEEIEINRSHADELLPALATLESQGMEWVPALRHALREMIAEPALYVMVKMRE